MRVHEEDYCTNTPKRKMGVAGKSPAERGKQTKSKSPLHCLLFKNSFQASISFFAYPSLLAKMSSFETKQSQMPSSASQIPRLEHSSFSLVPFTESYLSVNVNVCWFRRTTEFVGGGIGVQTKFAAQASLSSANSRRLYLLTPSGAWGRTT